jgi:hypothetical protein
MCLYEDLFYLTRARAEFLDRAGESAAALRWYHEAYHRCEGGDDLFRSCQARDLLLARYAILLNDAGEAQAAASVVRVLGKDSGSLGLSIARRALGTEPDLESRVTVFVLSLYDGVGNDTYGSATAFVVGDPQSATTWHLIAVSLPRYPDRSLGRRLAPDCGEDLEVVGADDARVRPTIQASIDQPYAFKWASGLLALHALDHSAREPLIARLEQMDVSGDAWGNPGASVDRAARLIFGDGPGIKADVLPTAEVRKAWLEWLR